MGHVIAVCRSTNKGEKKKPVPAVMLKANHGVEGDAHAGNGHRQVSLLAQESIGTIQDLGLAVSPGDFAENITTAGVDLAALAPGSRLRIGVALLEITQIGKECHSRCAIYEQVGDCVMPRDGVFARVISGGTVVPGDLVEPQC